VNTAEIDLDGQVSSGAQAASGHVVEAEKDPGVQAGNNRGAPAGNERVVPAETEADRAEAILELHATTMMMKSMVSNH
jgi:hypothetical protein